MSSWECFSYALAGTGHPGDCQDSVAHDRRADVQLIAVADGLGSAKHAGYGSRRAIESLLFCFRSISVAPGKCGALKSWLGELMGSTVQEFTRSLEAEGYDPDDCKTTLAFAALTRSWVGICSIGDNFAVAEIPRLGAQLLMAPDRPDSIGRNVTGTLPGGFEYLRTYVIQADWMTGVLLSTDGLEKMIPHRAVTDECGITRQIGWGPGSLDLFVGAVSERKWEDIIRALEDPRLRTMKGDDIGISMAARRDR